MGQRVVEREVVEALVTVYEPKGRIQREGGEDGSELVRRWDHVAVEHGKVCIRGHG